MTKSKWCRCDEPKFGPIYDGYRECFKCDGEQKCKNIRGTELIDYPFGTRFSHIGLEGKLFFLIRGKIGLIEIVQHDIRTKNEVIVEAEDIAYLMLQDSFKIVDETPEEN